MSNVHPFAPRRAAPAPLPVPSPAEIRSQIEEAAQAALDTADRLIALLDQIDGAADQKGVATTDTFAAPETLASQVIRLRGTTSDREQETAR